MQVVDQLIFAVDDQVGQESRHEHDDGVDNQDAPIGQRLSGKVPADEFFQLYFH
jgi:hypothetical protein